MTKISSRSTVFNKRALPVLWFGVVAIGATVSFWAGALQKQPLLILPPIILAAVGFVVMRKLVWDLVDEVYDCGDFLLVRSAGREDRVALPPEMAALAPSGGSWGASVPGPWHSSAAAQGGTTGG